MIPLAEHYCSWRAPVTWFKLRLHSTILSLETKEIYHVQSQEPKGSKWNETSVARKSLRSTSRREVSVTWVVLTHLPILIDCQNRLNEYPQDIANTYLCTDFQGLVCNQKIHIWFSYEVRVIFEVAERAWTPTAINRVCDDEQPVSHHPASSQLIFGNGPIILTSDTRAKGIPITTLAKQVVLWTYYYPKPCWTRACERLHPL